MSYLYLGGAFVMACLVAGLLWYRSEATQAVAERDAARADLAIAIDANAAQQATIGRLRATEEANAKQVAELLDQLDAINKAMSETTDAIHALEKQNADVAAYLGSAVPPDLKLLLNK